jgi:FkbM family methyltransferase
MNAFRQIQLANRDWTPGCIFDVGANMGQTVRQIRQVWPAVRVFAFEPVSATFAALEARTAGDAALECHRLAFGSSAGRATMLATPGHTMNRIVTRPEGGQATEEVEVVTGDAFCAARGLDRLDILKVDTEGHDLDVLTGFGTMLAERRVTYVEAECAIAPDNRIHVPFNRIADFMHARGYGLFSLLPAGRHPQGYLNHTTRRRQRGMFYANAVFVAEGELAA